MHRVVAGCNLWAILFLTVAVVLGWLDAPRHTAVGIFAAVFALLAQSAIFALFMGASKLVQEHVELFALPAQLLDRVNAIMFPLFRAASIGALAVLPFALFAGLGASGDVPTWLHLWAGAGAVAVLAVLLPGEVRGLRAMHQVLLDMEAALPERGSEPAPPPPRGAEAIDRGARALIYVGSTVLFMALGYRYIAGIRLPAAVLWTAGGLAALCLALALARRRRGAQAPRPLSLSTKPGSSEPR
jgi:hypothetical protein